MRQAREAVNEALERWIPSLADEPGGVAGEAIAYSLRGSGKRLRPALVLAAYREAGGTGDATDLAAAVEVVHTYSLVHDDLPCMDNDDLRRGRPTTHRAFDVGTATAAGFSMVPLAARMVAAGGRTLGIDGERLRGIGCTLFSAAGLDGMIAGQVLDLEAEGKRPTLAALTRIHGAKTGALIAASVTIGGIAAGLAGQRLGALRGYGREIGLAFQIVDDVLDTTMTSQELGKTAGKDAKQQKASFAALLGPEPALERAQECVRQAIDHLGATGIDCNLLPGLARFIADRRA